MIDKKLIKEICQEIHDEVEEAYAAYNELKERKDGDGVASLKFDSFFNFYRKKKSYKEKILIIEKERKAKDDKKKRKAEKR